MRIRMNEDFENIRNSVDINIDLSGEELEDGLAKEYIAYDYKDNSDASLYVTEFIEDISDDVDYYSDPNDISYVERTGDITFTIHNVRSENAEDIERNIYERWEEACENAKDMAEEFYRRLAFDEFVEPAGEYDDFDF